MGGGVNATLSLDGGRNSKCALLPRTYRLRGDQGADPAVHADVALELLDDVVHLTPSLVAGKDALICLLQLSLEGLDLRLSKVKVQSRVISLPLRN